ncbi:MAG: DUF192 domain-containing protein [Anaerolineae bacterium]
MVRHFRIVDACENMSLTVRPRVASGFFSRLIGLIGRTDAGPGLLIPECNWIHTFFMCFPIDVVYVDREGRVLELVEGLKPWRVGPWVREACAVLEFEAGTARGLGIRSGIRLNTVRCSS